MYPGPQLVILLVVELELFGVSCTYRLNDGTLLAYAQPIAVVLNEGAALSTNDLLLLNL